MPKTLYEKCSKKERAEWQRLQAAVSEAGDRRDWNATDDAEKELEKFKEQLRRRYHV